MPLAATAAAAAASALAGEEVRTSEEWRANWVADYALSSIVLLALSATGYLVGT